MRYERIRNLREDADWTQSDVGKMINISQRAYSHYENGTREIPIEIIIKLADMYSVNIDYLLDRTDFKDKLPDKK